LRSAEEDFLTLPGTLDDDAHRALWPRLADLNARLRKTEDAGLCWLNALWEPGESANGHAARWAAAWFRTESAAQGREVSRNLSGDDLNRLLAKPEPAGADVRVLASFLTWSSYRSPRPAALMSRLQAIQRFLEKHERLLPVRACWLAWYHLAELIGGDELALARARDRLLERLFHNGLRPEQDLPSFLRFAGQPTSQRFRDVRDWMKSLCDQAQAWVEKNRDEIQRPPMAPYVDLLFAFGLARLGEADVSRQLMRRARDVLADKDEVHALLLQCFEYRINEALEGRPHAGPLPPRLMEKLGGMVPMQRYLVDRLRKHSRILEPDQEIDPYASWTSRLSDLERALAEVAELTDRKEIVARLQTLLKETPKGTEGHEARARILRTALEVAPLIGEEFAREMLDQALPAYDALPALDSLPEDRKLAALEEQAKFLEKALFTAAHFGRVEHLPRLVSRFQKMLQTQRGPHAIESIEKLAGQCFRSLRKLGMRDEIDRLLTQMADVVLEGRPLDALVRKLNFKEDNAAALKVLLHIATSWYYFGRDQQADPVLQTIRAVLFKAAYPPLKQRDLACAYARTVGQTTVEVAKTRLEEIFRELKCITALSTSGTHFDVCQLDVIESVVLAIVSDDFTQGTQARRWLDDDEFLVRRRIHEDVRHLIARP
jgi:hypothetical protein